MMKMFYLLILLIFSFSSFAYITNDSNDKKVKAICNDGSYSTSSGQGTCSHHGGVKYYI